MTIVLCDAEAGIRDEGRKGEYIEIASGARFYVADPRPEDVNLDDIATAISKLCRFGGHSPYFYSVAQHSVYSCMMAPEGFKRAALLHDATEAYLVDLPRPIKRMLPGYVELEKGLERVIAEHFGLDELVPPEVKDVDNRMLVTEAAQFFKRPADCVPWWETMPGNPQPYGLKIQPWDPEIARAEFLDTYAHLVMMGIQ